MTEHGSAAGRCAFCRQPIPEGTVVRLEDDRDCCSNACRDALAAGREPFDGNHGLRHVDLGVAAFDQSLPQGLPRNAFVLVSGDVGTRDRSLQAELVWRCLERGEPAVVVSYQEPPGSLVQQFLSLEWNVLPYLESGQLRILDCFTYRVSNRERLFDRMDEWNRHLSEVAAEATTTVRDPTDLRELQNKLDNALEDCGMVSEGLVLLDSLTELGTLVQPVQAYKFVKDLRADVCKGRLVPVFAGGTRSASAASDSFPHDLDYVVDGVVELRLTDDLAGDALVKQLRVRKLNGVRVVPEWHGYEYTPVLGMVTFDPEERRDDPTAAEAAGAPDGDGGSPPSDAGEIPEAATVAPEPPDDPSEGAAASGDTDE